MTPALPVFETLHHSTLGSQQLTTTLLVLYSNVSPNPEKRSRFVMSYHQQSLMYDVLGDLEIMIRDSVQIDRLMSMNSSSADSILDLVSVPICGLQNWRGHNGLTRGDDLPEAKYKKH